MRKKTAHAGDEKGKVWSTEATRRVRKRKWSRNNYTGVKSKAPVHVNGDDACGHQSVLDYCHSILYNNLIGQILTVLLYWEVRYEKITGFILIEFDAHVERGVW